MRTLIQQVADINSRKQENIELQGLMLNEQSATNLPMDPNIQREIEEVQNSHIKIMGEN